MKLKVGDKLKCKSTRPYSAPVRAGEYVTISRICHRSGEIQFKIEGKIPTWYGDIVSGHWELPKVELTNK